MQSEKFDDIDIPTRKRAKAFHLQSNLEYTIDVN